MTNRGSGSVVAAGSVGVSLVAAGVLHVTGAGVVDPLRTVISDYVAVPGGYALLALAAVALATACLAVAAGLGPAGLPRPGVPASLLVSGAVALLVAAVVPTNLPGAPVGIAALVHRAAGGWVFFSLPLAGWLVARRSGTATGPWRAAAPLLRACAGTAAVVAAGYLMVHVPIVIAGSPIFPYLGGGERVVCATVMVVLLTTAWVIRSATGRAVPVARAAQDGSLAVHPVGVELAGLGRAA